ncbi:MAG: sensor histidine kinase [Alphaproteobacteria bacterium]|nr:sensor histidine kinase [Alphaproteobacteria bacterium]
MDAVLAKSRAIHHMPSSDPVAEANHRIANSLTLLVSMVRMQASAAARRSEPVTAADMRLALEAVAARIGTIGQLHRMLSLAPHDGATSLQPHLRDVSATLVAALSSPEQQVRVEHSGSDCLVLTRQVQPLVLILCEVFINAMKYAHPTGVPLTISVDCNSGPDGRLVISISDDGIGLPDAFDHQKDGGLGFRVIRSLAAELGAELSVESSALGLCFRLSLPAAAMPGGKLS